MYSASTKYSMCAAAHRRTGSPLAADSFTPTAVSRGFDPVRSRTSHKGLLKLQTQQPLVFSRLNVVFKRRLQIEISRKTFFKKKYIHTQLFLKRISRMKLKHYFILWKCLRII